MDASPEILLAPPPEAAQCLYAHLLLRNAGVFRAESVKFPDLECRRVRGVAKASIRALLHAMFAAPAVHAAPLEAHCRVPRVRFIWLPHAERAVSVAGTSGATILVATAMALDP